MKNAVLFIIMLMCMISVSAFAVDYSHDKSPPGIEVYDGIQSDVLIINDIKIQAIGSFDMESVEVVYIGDIVSSAISNKDNYLRSELTFDLINENKGICYFDRFWHNGYSMLC